MIKYLLANLTLVFTIPVALVADGNTSIIFGLTTTQEASGFSKVLQNDLNNEFPNWNFTYSVAGSSQQLRALNDNFIPFAITHNSQKELELVSVGKHSQLPLFSNDFLLVGPKESPIECSSLVKCMEVIAENEKPFLSRGDGSGTNAYELSLWKEAGIDPLILTEYMVASGGAANSLRICQIQDCFMIIDESSYDFLSTESLLEIARDINANVYSLIYSEEFANSSQGKVIPWLVSRIPQIVEQFGYKNYNKEEN